MKKVLRNIGTFALVLVIGSLLVACGGGNNNKEKEKEKDNTIADELKPQGFYNRNLSYDIYYFDGNGGMQFAIYTFDGGATPRIYTVEHQGIVSYSVAVESDILYCRLKDSEGQTKEGFHSVNGSFASSFTESGIYTYNKITSLKEFIISKWSGDEYHPLNLDAAVIADGVWAENWNLE